jgi:hypothetical protein
VNFKRLVSSFARCAKPKSCGTSVATIWRALCVAMSSAGYAKAMPGRKLSTFSMTTF